MDNFEATQQRLCGQVSCLGLVMQQLIHTHPNKPALLDALLKIEADVPDMMALQHPGRPAIDGGFRELLSVFIKVAQ
jgi:hypothetical protein